MPAPPVLAAYRRERDERLDRIVTSLTRDPRVAAAWLFGSLGRGDADELSDLDLWVVMADEYIGEIVARRRVYAAQTGEPMLVSLWRHPKTRR